MGNFDDNGYKPSRMFNILYFLLGRKVWGLFELRNKLGRFLFRKFGVKFVWLDLLVRRFKIASHIEIYDAKRNMIIVDGKLLSFYSKEDGHYIMYVWKY
ncbi:hypothetical protein PQ462_12595 [Flavobacterium sp. KACC 22758]|uniref:hypothetical protein n=1 Tax=Flavobacterium sp. KACC 22758 TaxID=3025667 RepID=UPI0023657A84|nr:hypothetical protein [Flavobacterium sp. KACC 22758]WDF57555.1 hypothetical protein PQ462_12595 [Flavobacterium sp. KACC 22758]